MHPRNRYKDHPPDFVALAGKYPPLKPYLDATNHFDASQPGAVRELVNALMRVDFNIASWEGVPDGYLIPSVTRSLNYLHFVEDLIEESTAKALTNESLREKLRLGQGDEQQTKRPRPERTIRVFDVGVGASCIFPLLGCALHSDWTFVGMDVDETSLEYAKRNSQQFTDRIDIRKSVVRDRPDVSNVLGTSELSSPDEVETFDVLMCNPPFFASASDEIRPFGGTALERSCPGGEVQFISHLIDESVRLQKQFVWFTCMLGLKESTTAVLAKLHHHAKAETIRMYRLDQGNKNRWVIAWSFFSELTPHAVYGQKQEIDNALSAQDSVPSRTTDAFKELRNFTVETGICGGEGFRFRIRIVDLTQPNDARPSFRVDALDIKGGEEGEVRARSVIRKVEQLILRKSRKWKKQQGNVRSRGGSRRGRTSGIGRGRYFSGGSQVASLDEQQDAEHVESEEDT